MEGLPVWASWSFKDWFISENFYSIGGFELAITDIGVVAFREETLSPTLILAFGLVLREIAWARQRQDGGDQPEGVLSYVNSDFLTSESEERVLNIINRLL